MNIIDDFEKLNAIKFILFIYFIKKTSMDVLKFPHMLLKF